MFLVEFMIAILHAMLIVLLIGMILLNPFFLSFFIAMICKKKSTIRFSKIMIETFYGIIIASIIFHYKTSTTIFNQRELLIIPVFIFMLIYSNVLVKTGILLAKKLKNYHSLPSTDPIDAEKNQETD